MNHSDCRRHLSDLAQKDRFLSQVDQRPLLDGMLQQMDAAVKAALNEADRQLAETVQKLDGELTQATDLLRKAKELLSEEFSAVLATRPLSPEALAGLARSIEGRILWLYDRVRSRLERNLRRIGLKEPVPGEFLQTVKEAWAKPCSEMPEDLVLIIDRQEQHEAAGRSIWEIEGDRLIEKACNGHVFFTRWLTYLRLRQQLRRRYRVLHSEPCDTLDRHQPALLQKETLPALENCRKQHEEMFRAFAGLWRNLRFNLETAAEDCSLLAKDLSRPEAAPKADQQLGETDRLVAETLTRSADQLATIAGPLKEAWQQLLTELERDRDEILAVIPRDLQRELSWQERAMHSQRRMVRALGRWREQGRQRLNSTRQYLAERLGQLPSLGHRLFSRSARDRGREGTLLQLSDLPTTADILSQASLLPPVCRRLFTMGALKNREFLVGKETDLENLRELFRRWQEGRLCSIAVVGPHGSGKSSLVNCFESELDQQTTLHHLAIDSRLGSAAQLLELCTSWFNLPAIPKDLDALEKQLNQLPPAVVIVNNAHRLLLRTPGGLQSTRAFLRLVLATRRRLLWIITCRKYPWQRMQQLLQIDRYFTHQLQTPFGTQAEMREALLLRLQTSSYPVVFLENNPADNQPLKNGTDQDALQERFFTDLFAATGATCRPLSTTGCCAFLTTRPREP
ncbi:MAG: ATP-binding protein [Syntrophotaleaceae bacterium]